MADLMALMKQVNQWFYQNIDEVLKTGNPEVKDHPALRRAEDYHSMKFTSLAEVLSGFFDLPLTSIQNEVEDEENEFLSEPITRNSTHGGRAGAIDSGVNSSFSDAPKEDSDSSRPSSADRPLSLMSSREFYRAAAKRCSTPIDSDESEQAVQLERLAFANPFFTDSEGDSMRDEHESLLNFLNRPWSRNSASLCDLIPENIEEKQNLDQDEEDCSKQQMSVEREKSQKQIFIGDADEKISSSVPGDTDDGVAQHVSSCSCPIVPSCSYTVKETEPIQEYQQPKLSNQEFRKFTSSLIRFCDRRVEEEKKKRRHTALLPVIRELETMRIDHSLENFISTDAETSNDSETQGKKGSMLIVPPAATDPAEKQNIKENQKARTTALAVKICEKYHPILTKSRIPKLIRANDNKENDRRPELTRNQ